MAISKCKVCMLFQAMASLCGLGMRGVMGTMGGGVCGDAGEVDKLCVVAVFLFPMHNITCGAPRIELMFSMPSPQHCEYVSRVRVNAVCTVRLYIEKRCRAIVRARQHV